MLSEQDMKEICHDVAVKRPSRLKTPEAKAFRKSHEDFADGVGKAGGQIEYPSELVDVDEPNPLKRKS